MISQPRSSILQALKSTEFDVTIIGGGISGAWIALHCSLLGFKVAIVERGDFAGETSSASSKLLHGGIRYLQQLQFGKVRESTMERAAYIEAAPHLCHLVPFLVPTYRDLKRSKFLLRSGIAAYQMLGLGQKTVAPSLKDYDLSIQNFNTEQLNSICDINHLEHTGGIAFPEFHMHDTERTVWAVIESAQETGASALNYIAATQIEINNKKVTGVAVVDNESGEQFSINSKLVVNAAGPWVDNLNPQSTDSILPTEDNRLIQNYAVGAHVITRQLTSEYAIAISTKEKSVATIDRGGRHIFIIPWRGYSLIGTSYRETQDPDNTSNLDKEDLHQLLEAVNETLPTAQLTANDIISAYTGLYPLRTNTQLATTYQGSGEYIILDHAVKNGVEGLITSLGAKYTTGRILAEKTSRLVESKLRSVAPTKKASLKTKLACAQYTSLEEFTSTQLIALKEKFSELQIQHLINTYGSNLKLFIEYIEAQHDEPNLLSELVDGQPDILAQAAWAVDKEMALHLDDVLLRRTSSGQLGMTTESVTTVAELMAKKLGWTHQQRDAEIAKTLSRQEEFRKTAVDFYNEI